MKRSTKTRTVARGAKGAKGINPPWEDAPPGTPSGIREVHLEMPSNPEGVDTTGIQAHAPT